MLERKTLDSSIWALQAQQMLTVNIVFVGGHTRRPVDNPWQHLAGQLTGGGGELVDHHSVR